VNDPAAEDVENGDEAERQRTIVPGATMRVLIHEWVTGGGLAGRPLPESWAREGRAMRQALADDFRCVDGVDVVTSLDPRFGDGETGRSTVIVPEAQEESVLARLAAECDYTLLIAPETGGTLERLAVLVEGSAGRTLGCTPGAIALAADKALLAEHLAREGVPTPPVEWFDPAAGRPPSFGFPAVVKPVDGAGSLDTWLVGALEELASIDGTGRGWIAQPYVEGAAMSASFLVEPGGAIHLLGVGWQDVALDCGRLVYRGGRLPGPIELGLGEPLDAVRSVPGLRGFVGVDFIEQGNRGRTTVIEINPRLTTSFVGWRHLHRPGTIARAWLKAFLEVGNDPGLVTPWELPTSGSIRFGAEGSVVEMSERGT
jgi:predicted ATP-grasp superfamily ATP-dependent carboligase